MKNKITSNQLYVLLFLSSIMFLASLSTETLNGNLWDSIPSVLIAFIINIGLCVPILLLNKHEGSVQEMLGKSKVYVVVFALYVLYFLVCNIVSLARLQNLFLNTIFPEVSPLVLGLLIIVTAFYGAYKGVESVARSAWIVLIFASVSIILMIFGVINLVDLTNREQFFYDGIQTATDNIFVVLTRSSIAPQFAVLIFCTKEKQKQKMFYISQIIAGVMVILSIFLVVVTMGRFANTQIYPFYTLFSISKLAPFERLDVLFSLIWLMILTIKLSVNILAVKSIVTKPSFLKYDKFFMAIFSALTLFSTIFIVGKNVEIFNLLEMCLIPIIVILGTIIPLICYFKVIK